MDILQTPHHQEYLHPELTEAGLDGIPAKLLKDAAQEVAKPIANLINLTFSTGEIPQE